MHYFEGLLEKPIQKYQIIVSLFLFLNFVQFSIYTWDMQNDEPQDLDQLIEQ